MLNPTVVITKTVLLIILAPALTGFIAKVKNTIRMRKGPGIMQPYYNVKKLFSKGEVVSKHVSWIFYAAPVIVFASAVCALVLISCVGTSSSAQDRITVMLAAFFVLSMARFFMALGGLDAASSFGGMGSSREMFISALAEPSAFVSIFVLCLAGTSGFKISLLLSGISLLLVTLAETSRIPVDNRETHLELTMIHEAMILEYSGRSLALIELAGHIKQILYLVILCSFFFEPAGLAMSGWISLPAGIMIIAFVIAMLEVSVAKMRLFRAVDFLGFSFFMALAASVAACMGL